MCHDSRAPRRAQKWRASRDAPRRGRCARLGRGARAVIPRAAARGSRAGTPLVLANGAPNDGAPPASLRNGVSARTSARASLLPVRQSRIFLSSLPDSPQPPCSQEQQGQARATAASTVPPQSSCVSPSQHSLSGCVFFLSAVPRAPQQERRSQRRLSGKPTPSTALRPSVIVGPVTSHWSCVVRSSVGKT